jgi:transposase
VARAQHAGDQQAHRIRSQNDSQVSAEAGRDTCVGTRPARPSKLDAFKPYIEERLKAGVWNAQVLLRELRARGFSSGYTILKDWLHPQRTAAQTVAVRRFETPPGK